MLARIASEHVLLVGMLEWRLWRTGVAYKLEFTLWTIDLRGKMHIER